MTAGIICSLFSIAAHYSYQAAVGHFVKCRSAFSFGYVAAAYNSPVYFVHDNNLRRDAPMHRGVSTVFLQFLQVLQPKTRYCPGILKNRTIVQGDWRLSIPRLPACLLIARPMPFVPAFGRDLSQFHLTVLSGLFFHRSPGFFAEIRLILQPLNLPGCHANT